MPNRHKQGISLLETIIALAVMMVIGSALVTMTVTVLSAQNGAKLKNIATHCAETGVEYVRYTEQTYRSQLQASSPTTWVGPYFTVFNSPSVFDCAFGNTARFFKLSLTYDYVCSNGIAQSSSTCPGGTSLIGLEAKVAVAWTDKGKNLTTLLNTRVTKWQ